MCGLGGILRRDGQPIPDEWLDVIDDRIAHRGPDDTGRFRDHVTVEGERGPITISVAFVHRRLSIIDLDDGAQPMVAAARDDDDGRVAVVFNGCIYNHRALRQELEASGHEFATDHSDTEVLLHGYREWRGELTEHLEGMYAFAIWDGATGSLMLARDWFGEKPMYVRRLVDDGLDVLAFSSDAAALARLADRVLPSGTAAVHHWAATYMQLGYNWQGQSVYVSDGPDAVSQVPPTIRETVDTWVPTRTSQTTSLVEFEQLLEQAVARRLESDVPLGCFLSGGVDSSLIAAYAKRHHPGVRTFCVRMPDDRYDESRFAEEVARELETDHTTLDVAINPAEDLVHLVRLLGQPFGDSSLLPTYWVSRAARAHVKVALSGDGGDELFIGYRRYMAARHLVRHRRVLRWLPARLRRGAHPKSRRDMFGRLGEMARDLPKLGVLGMESLFTVRQIRDLIGVDPFDMPEQSWGLDPMQALRRIDLQSYLPDDLLCKVDTASMAVALEVRAPFLDRDLVRAALAAPTWQLAPNGRRKGLLREMAKRLLPADLVDRPKMGFAIPIGEWFRDDFGGMRTLLQDTLAGDAPFGPIDLDMSVVQSMVDEHLDGTLDHSQRLFALLTLGLWAREH